MKLRSKTLTAISCLILCGYSSISQADNSAEQNHQRQKYESKGVVSGIVIGAIAGGPVGAVVSAATGGWLGNKLFEAKQGRILKNELALAQEQLKDLRLHNDQLQNQYLALSEELENRNLLASTNVRTSTSTNCCSDSELVLHFRSNSAVIEEHYFSALEDFVSLAKSLPSSQVEIIGHADRRGAANKNLALSQKRVQELEHTLRSMGLQQASYSTKANGEQDPLSNEDNFEANFFDRRVTLRLLNDQGQLLTQSQR